MITNPPEEANTLDRLRSLLENFRTRLTDMEALAHCASHTLERLPYLPLAGRETSPGQPGPDPEARRNYGRLQSLVAANAQAATELLDECNRIIDCAYDEDDFDPDDDDGDPDEDDDSGPGTPDEGDSGPDSPDDEGDGGPATSPGGGPAALGDTPENGHNGALTRSRSGIALDTRLLP